MTREERVKKLKYLITCMKCEVSGKVCDDNCPTQYNAGNMGEIIENLEEIAKALEQEPILDKVRAEIMALRNIRAEEFDIDIYSDVFDDRVILRSDVLEILDKYKAESEG